jgi:chemotaxis protein methyltransferase CheR
MSIAPTDFDYVRDLVRRRSAIVLDAGKEYLVESRLLPVARSNGEGTVGSLLAKVRMSPDGPLARDVVDAMTTNETSWFRDSAPFAALEKYILPELQKARSMERSLSFWSAACSSGQEPYSLAMVLRDFLEKEGTWRVRILATDLSAEMVRRTQGGRYSQIEINRGLPVARMVKDFTRAGRDWQVNEQLRRMVEVQQLNLAEPFAHIGQFDVVFIRNVLIYFDPPTKKAVLERVRRVLRPGGFLFLGGAETTFGIDDRFERLTFDRATVYRVRGGEA